MSKEELKESKNNLSINNRMKSFKEYFEESNVVPYKASKKSRDPEVLQRMFKLLQYKAEFYCDILGWPKGEGSSEHIKPTNLQEVMMQVPEKIKMIEQRGYDWNRVFIVAHKVMDPEQENFARVSQLMDITNTITLINNSSHIIVKAYDPYGVMKGKELTIQKPVSIPSALAQAEGLLQSLYK
jgi:hypothetical protein